MRPRMPCAVNPLFSIPKIVPWADRVPTMLVYYMNGDPRLPVGIEPIREGDLLTIDLGTGNVRPMMRGDAVAGVARSDHPSNERP